MTEETKPLLDRYIAFVDRWMNPPKKPVPPEPAIRYAEFGARLFACTIDMLLSLLILAPFLQLLSDLIYMNRDLHAIQQQMRLAPTFTEQFAVLTESGMLKNMLVDYIVHLGIIGVVTVTFWVKLSGTPGKRLMRMRVVDEETLLPPSARQSVLRFLGYIPSAAPLFLGFFAINWDRKRQGWHDKIAHTVVLQDPWNWPWSKKKEGPSSASPTAPPSSAAESAASE